MEICDVCGKPFRVNWIEQGWTTMDDKIACSFDCCKR